MKTHTTIGASMLSGGRYELLQLAEVIAFSHHERWDGEGYPRGQAGEQIPIEARIVSVVDAFDAMTNDRPYRWALPPEEAWEVLWDGAGAQWDKNVAAACASIKSRLARGTTADPPGASRTPRVATHLDRWR